MSDTKHAAQEDVRLLNKILEGKFVKKKLFVVLIILLMVSVLLNPYRFMTTNMIKNYMMLKIPLETNMEEVEETIKKMNLEILYISNDCGYDDSEVDTEEVVGRKIGEKYIKVRLCEYRTLFLLSTDIVVYFAFDNDSKLMNIGISEQVDSL